MKLLRLTSIISLLAAIIVMTACSPSVAERDITDEPTAEPTTAEPTATDLSTVVAGVTETPLSIEATVELTEPATSTPDLDPTVELALSGVSSNGNWTPSIQTFDGIDMALVPAGCFLMGSDGGDADERPPHEICVESPFWIAVTEVTNLQYGSNGNYLGDNRPRDELTWFEAHDFCESRGERLPTEAEWEYAARGPDALDYPWGMDFWPTEEDVLYICALHNAADVGSCPLNASWVGAVDMTGNLREWVSSIYRPYPFDATDGRESMENIEENRYRVLRGGSFSDLDDPYALRAAHRQWYDWNFSLMDIGFRCVRDASLK